MSTEATHNAAVVVTGAGSGIGRAVVGGLLARGYRVFGSAISSEEADGLVVEFGDGLFPFVVDVRDEDAVFEAAGRIEAELDGMPLKAVLNIAGVLENGPLVDLTAEQFRNVLAVNLVGVHVVTRAFLPQLSASGGRIVNVSSSSGRRTLPFTAAYGPSKVAVEALTAVMRMEYAALAVDAVLVAPAMINTPMADKIKRDIEAEPSLAVYREPLRRFRAGVEETFANGIPIERMVETCVEAVEAERPKLRYAIHQSVLRDVLLFQLMPTRLREALVRKRLALDPAGS